MYCKENLRAHDVVAISRASRQPRLSSLDTDLPPYGDIKRGVATLGGSLPSILEHIKDDAIALSIWWRDPPIVAPLIDFAAIRDIRFTATPAVVAKKMHSALASSCAAPWHDVVANDVRLLAIRFAQIMDTGHVKVRLEPVSTDACRKFHTDCVSAHLITTYVGPGTQWRHADEGGTTVVHQLRTGDVGVFKGRVADRTPGIVHRSPPITGTGERRLVLVIDTAQA